MAVKKMARDIKDQSVKAAPREMLEDLFQDFYSHRMQIYWMNFIRGICLGFGTVIGGTIIIALLIWFLSWFNELPFIGDTVRNFQNSIQESRQK